MKRQTILEIILAMVGTVCMYISSDSQIKKMSDCEIEPNSSRHTYGVHVENDTPKDIEIDDPTEKDPLAKLFGLSDLLKDSAKRKLFSLDDLTDVDLSTKHVTIDVTKDVYSGFGENAEEIFKKLKEFYEAGGIVIDFKIVDQVDYKSLSPTEHLAIITSDKAEKTEKHTKLGRAEIENSRITIYLENINTFRKELTKSLQELSQTADTYSKESKQDQELTEEFGRIKEKTDRITHNLAVMNFVSTINHELGHMFGLFHPDYFESDLFPSYNANGLPNCMFSALEAPDSKFITGCSFTDLQRRIMHSYLSKGKVYQARMAVGFDTLKYMTATASVNNLHYSLEYLRMVSTILGTQ